MNDTGKIILAFAAGALAGAIAGVLLAPDKGSETRRKMSEGMKDQFAKGRQKFDDLKEQFEQAVKDKVQEMV
ncbi:MAG: YtxH domain-containing protein [Chitinophagaceae bacterium]|nr:YtxH domain-containing protein [Chitinophagaceae bacterium]